jgi:hypothetical protein
VSNGPEVVALAIDVAVSVSMAKFDELEAQSYRLRDLVDQSFLIKQEAVDILYHAALAADLVRVSGPDIIQEIIAAGFEEEPS